MTASNRSLRIVQANVMYCEKCINDRHRASDTLKPFFFSLCSENVPKTSRLNALKSLVLICGIFSKKGSKETTSFHFPRRSSEDQIIF